MTKSDSRVFKINRARRMLAEIKETIAAATPGTWTRDHSVVTSWVGDRGPALHSKGISNAHQVTVAFAVLGEEIIRRHGFAPADPERGNANTRHICATEPTRMALLIKALEELFPDLVAIPKDKL